VSPGVAFRVLMIWQFSAPVSVTFGLEMCCHWLLIISIHHPLVKSEFVLNSSYLPSNSAKHTRDPADALAFPRVTPSSNQILEADRRIWYRLPYRSDWAQQPLVILSLHLGWYIIYANYALGIEGNGISFVSSSCIICSMHLAQSVSLIAWFCLPSMLEDWQP
jgi:hypothetical protein